MRVVALVDERNHLLDMLLPLLGAQDSDQLQVLQPSVVCQALQPREERRGWDLEVDEAERLEPQESGGAVVLYVWGWGLGLWVHEQFLV